MPKAPKFKPGQSGFAGRKHTEESRRKMQRERLWRAAAKKQIEAGRLTLGAPDTVTRHAVREAAQATIRDAFAILREAEPMAADRLLAHIRARNAPVSLGAIRELFDRTRGKAVQQAQPGARRTRITVITGVPGAAPVQIDVDEATAAGMECLAPAPGAPEQQPADEMHTLAAPAPGDSY